MRHFLTSVAFGIAALVTVVLASIYLNNEIDSDKTVVTEMSKVDVKTEQVI